MARRGSQGSGIGWLIAIGLAICWVQLGGFWTILIFIGILGCLHVRNLYRRRYM